MCDSNPLTVGRYTVRDYLCTDFFNSGIVGWIASKQLSTDNIRKMLCYYSIDHTKGTSEYATEATESPLLTMAKDYVWHLFGGNKEMGFLPMTVQNDKASNWHEGNGERCAAADMVTRTDVADYFTHTTATASPAMTAINQAFKMNNLTIGWEPQHPLVVFHSKHDEVVC